MAVLVNGSALNPILHRPQAAKFSLSLSAKKEATASHDSHHLLTFPLHCRSILLPLSLSLSLSLSQPHFIAKRHITSPITIFFTSAKHYHSLSSSPLPLFCQPLSFISIFITALSALPSPSLSSSSLHLDFHGHTPIEPYPLFISFIAFYISLVANYYHHPSLLFSSPSPLIGPSSFFILLSRLFLHLSLSWPLSPPPFITITLHHHLVPPLLLRWLNLLESLILLFLCVAAAVAPTVLTSLPLFVFIPPQLPLCEVLKLTWCCLISLSSCLLSCCPPQAYLSSTTATTLFPELPPSSTDC
ncbi:hypothetical protein CRG98_002914 [Punica granatum]|uniref:Uncharacterized protein n=1 Tax=Punica granatum TaxID=22663 RepID=A0A2I0L7B5_PUNGR|nr:hypothetical protein CRG98_002914 [Punica granatum]